MRSEEERKKRGRGPSELKIEEFVGMNYEERKRVIRKREGKGGI